MDKSLSGGPREGTRESGVVRALPTLLPYSKPYVASHCQEDEIPDLQSKVLSDLVSAFPATTLLSHLARCLWLPNVQQAPSLCMCALTLPGLPIPFPPLP